MSKRGDRSSFMALSDPDLQEGGRSKGCLLVNPFCPRVEDSALFGDPRSERGGYRPTESLCVRGDGAPWTVNLAGSNIVV